MPHPDRRRFLKTATMAALSAALAPRLMGGETVTLPFANGERRLVQFPGKRPLILLTHRPPQLETPFSVFNEGVLTPNDAFFVRYHLAGIPLSIDPQTYRLEIKGEVEKPLSFSLEELKRMEATEVVAVNQCSGNSRGLMQPRVGGGQWAHGAMGNARWKGVRLKTLVEKAGLKPEAKEVVFNGLDMASIPQTPDYVKALTVEHAMDGECLVAYEMNGEPLPMLNGFPIRLVVPGYYATYWIKHLSEIQVISGTCDNFWMATAYRVPQTPDGNIEPGTAPTSTEPIKRLNVRSFITSVQDGATVTAGALRLRGIAFDGGSGITAVQLSDDGGQTWQSAQLGQDLGPYSFREWTLDYTPKAQAGATVELMSRATSGQGETQPMQAGWNPSGYLRNVVERVRITLSA